MSHDVMSHDAQLPGKGVELVRPKRTSEAQPREYFFKERHRFKKMECIISRSPSQVRLILVR